MKHQWLIMSAIALAIGSAWAQTPATLKAAATAPAHKVYTYVEEMPQPPGGGGNAAIVALIQQSIHLPPFSVDSIVGSRVMVAFIVTEGGEVRNVRIRQSIDKRIDTAVVRAVQALPRFTPGRQQGRPVKVSFMVPITFHWQQDLGNIWTFCLKIPTFTAVHLIHTISPPIPMVFTPSPMLLKLLYTRGSLHNLPDNKGVAFSIKNRLDTVKVTGFRQVQIGDMVVPAEKIQVDLGNGEIRLATDINPDGQAIELPVGRTLMIVLDTPPLAEGIHAVQAWFSTDAFGDLHVEVEDAIVSASNHKPRIPRSDEDDYSEAAIAARQRFAEQFSGKEFTHLKHYSFDAHQLQGNCEHFMGVAQIPVGLAGPLTVNGEHAQGDFLIPMATTEGTLVASYNRGMQVLNLCGGVKCTVVGDAMQRAPVFVFDDARGARDFGQWVEENIGQIRPQAESTSSVAKLQYIDTYLSNKFAYLRFNYSTGDAAGQNMVGRATFAACSWILENYKGPKIEHFYLESNFATDKKASQINVMRTRGKRVVAEAVVKRDVLMQRMRVTPEQLAYHGQVSNVGAFISGANNNGAHSANGITALFIATGQDVANVSESSAGILYSEVTKEGDLYISITIPSLIVATHGGGTGLATQNECLQMLGCVGRGTVRKFAEIVAGVVLAGELSLGAAISSSDWVSSHEQYGRNR